MPDETPITKLSGIPPWLAVHHTEESEAMLKPVSDENWYGVPLEECPAVTDVIVEGVERMEILGEYGRLVYWHWRYRGGQWERAVVDVAIVRPMSSFAGPIEAWCPRVVRVPRINPVSIRPHH
jgi:hypothetical protein